MGRADAKADGIRMITRRNQTVYYPRCFFCLNEIEVVSYLSKRHYVCSQCKPLKKTFHDYYSDKESKTIFEAISRENALRNADGE